METSDGLHETASSSPKSAPRALLIQPPVYDAALYDLFHQPFGLLRIGEWLLRSGYRVELLDCLDPRARSAAAGRGRFIRKVVETPAVLRSLGRRFARYGRPDPEIRGLLRAARPDVVLVTTGMTYWYPGVREIGRLIREEAPGVPVIAGGIYATLMPDHCAEQLETDGVVRGAASHLERRIDGTDGARRELPGSAGAPRAGGLAAALADVDLPAPAGSLPYQPSVRLRAGSGRLRDAAAIRLHEGCTHRCAYCASPVITPRFLAGHAGALLAHIGELHDRFGMRTFAFYDDALLERSREGLMPFLEGVVATFGERAMQFYLPNAVHMDLLDEDSAALMYRAGFREVRFGLESAEEGFHSTLDRKLSLNRLAHTVGLLKQADFTGGEITAYVMLGLPGQAFATVRETLDIVEGLGIGASVAEYSPVPGSRLFDEAAAASGLDLTEPLLHNNSAFSLLSGFVAPKELTEAKTRARTIRRAMMK